MPSNVSTLVIAILVLLAVAALALLVLGGLRARRSRDLRRRFGPEYDRALGEAGGRDRAEALLSRRVRERRELRITDLDRATRDRYAAAWRSVQVRFVDDPEGALREADGLLIGVMRARGYPTDDQDRRIAMLSVDHAPAVEGYRHAHTLVAERGGHDLATDEMREAMLGCRDLFERLLGEPVRTGEARAATDAGPPRPEEGK
jgi:hypothetical protein